MEYSSYFVAYIDILGFKDMIIDLKASEIADFRERLWEGIKSSGVGAINRLPCVKLFSDSLIMTVPAREYPLAIFLFTIGRFEANMASLGFFLRGAVVNGNHYEDDRLAFGPALIEAVEFETTLALWPRIVVHPQLALRDPLYSHEVPRWPPENTLRMDSDGMSYIDYLAIGSDEPTDSFIKQHKEQVMKQTAKVRKQTEESRKTSVYRALAKYNWLADYHNNHVEEWELGETLKIDLSTSIGQG